MDLKHIIGVVLDFLTVYGDRFAIACFGAALAILVPLLFRLIRALLRPLFRRRAPVLEAAVIAPTAAEGPRAPGSI